MKQNSTERNNKHKYTENRKKLGKMNKLTNNEEKKMKSENNI